MNYVFWGTPQFADIILDALLRANMPPIALVCNPDRPVGRKKIITAPETKRRILNAEYRNQNIEDRNREKIKILQPEKIDENFIQQLKDLHPDFFIVVAYAKIIPKTILDIPKFGALGVHPSLLPRYRGASPIQSAILNGEKETGVTIYQMDEKTDHGHILVQSTSRIRDEETYLQLEEELAELSGKLLIENISKFIKGRIKSIAQDENAATFTKKFQTQDGFIAPENLSDAEAGNSTKAEMVSRKIRALNPESGAWTMKDGKRLKLLEAKIVNGALVLTKTQEEGQKPKILEK